MERIILHIDVNNAFLSWSAVEMIKKGYKDIRNECSVIGGDESERRGIVLAKSTIAKKFGIVTAESLFSARKKYKNLKVYPPDYEIYKKYSNLMYKYLCNYSSSIERYSIDECFVDYTESVNLFGDPIKLAYKIKDDIKEKFGFTVNVGIGNNKLCAKMASDFLKPDRVHTLFDNEIEKKLWPLDVSDLFMIGKKTSEKLNELKIKTVYDLAHYNIDILKKIFKSQAVMMVEYANGIDESPLETYSSPKNISSGTVLPYDYVDIKEIKKVIRDLTLEIGRRLRKNEDFANVLVISIKYGNFEKISKQKKLEKGINLDIDLYNQSVAIFKEIWNKKAIRHICVGVKDFSKIQSIQLSLANNDLINENKNNNKLQSTIDDIRKKYGNDIMIYGDMIEKEHKFY